MCIYIYIYIYVYKCRTNAVWEYRLFSCTRIAASEQEEGKVVKLHVVETEWEVKNIQKNFHDVPEKGRRGAGVETKRHVTFFREQIELRLDHKVIVWSGVAMYLLS